MSRWSGTFGEGLFGTFRSPFYRVTRSFRIHQSKLLPGLHDFHSLSIYLLDEDYHKIKKKKEKTFYQKKKQTLQKPKKNKKKKGENILSKKNSRPAVSPINQIQTSCRDDQDITRG